MEKVCTQLHGLINQVMNYKSLTTQAPYETELALFLETFLKHFNFKTKHQIIDTIPQDDKLFQRFNLLAEKGRGDQTILVFAHLDTRMQHHAWISPDKSHFFVSDRIYAPGILSTKGGLIALLDALPEIDPLNFKLKIALLADGEGQQAGMLSLVNSGWLDNITLAITTQPLDSSAVIHAPHRIMARTDNEFMKNDHANQLILNIEDYLKDYLNVSTIWHYPNDGTPESAILAEYATKQSLRFPIIGLAPQGEISTQGEWVALNSLTDMCHIFKFILNGHSLL